MNVVGIGPQNEMVVDCDFGLRHAVKPIGAHWDKKTRTWRLALTVRNADMLTDAIPDVALTDDAVREVKVQIERERKLARLRVAAQRDEEAWLKVPGLKMPLRNYQKIGVLYALNGSGGVLIADEMGLGKCSVSSSVVATYDGASSVGCLFETKFEGTPFKVDPGGGEWYALRPGQELELASRVEERLDWQSVKSLYRERVSRIAAVETQDGGRVSVGLRHGFLTPSGWKECRSLRVGDWIQVAERVEVGRPCVVDHNLAVFVAWQISEGDEGGRSTGNSFRIHQKDHCVLHRLWTALSSRFAVTDASGVRDGFLYACSGQYKSWLLSEFPDYAWGSNSGDRVIPLRIQNSQPKALRAFLRAYWDAEGCCNVDNLEISSKSEQVIRALHYMHRRLGILGVLSQIWRATGRGRERYWRMNVGGEFARRFASEVGFGLASKSQRLDALCQRATNTNVGLSVPCRELLREILDLTGLSPGAIGLQSSVYVSQSTTPQNPSRDLVRAVADRLDCFMANGLPPVEGRWAKRRRRSAAAFEQHRDRVAAIRDQLRRLSLPGFLWLRVESAEVAHREEWVYDFEMDGEPNYLVDMCVGHNTLQAIGLAAFQHARSEWQHCLVVVPASLKYNWPREIEKFTDLPYVVIDGSPKERVGQWLREDVYFYIVNYELVTEDLFGGRTYNFDEDDDPAKIARKQKLSSRAKVRAKQLASVRERVWGCVVCDECFHPDTRIRLWDGSTVSLSSVVCQRLPVVVPAYNQQTCQFEPRKVVDWYKNSRKQCYRLLADGGASYPSLDHQYLTPSGLKSVGDIRVGDEIVFLDDRGISDLQLGALAGTLLGGSCLVPPSGGTRAGRCRIAFNHGPDQEDYARWKAMVFGGDFGIDVVPDGGHGDWTVQACSKSIVTKTDHDRFYRGDKKVVTDSWLAMVNELGLALWLMDEGSPIVKTRCEGLARRKTYLRLHAEGFSADEVSRIVRWLRRRWGVQAKMNESKGRRYITLSGPGSEKLLRIVAPFVPLAMRHKLGCADVDPYSLDLEGDDFEVKVRPRVSRVHALLPHKVPCTTYNIQVEGLHMYVAASAVVANCHALKNPKSKRSKHVKALKASFRVGLSGTPLDGRLEELHSIMEWLVPYLFEPRTRFLQRYAEFDFWGQVSGYHGLEEVRKRVEPFFLRRLKRNVLTELPDKIYQNRFVALGKAERKLYRQLKEHEHELTEEADARQVVLRCRQCCLHSELLDEDTKQHAKLDDLREVLDEVVLMNGNKALVFSQYTTMAEIICGVLEDMGISFLYIHGDVPTSERAAAQERFATDAALDVIVGTDAMSQGLNFPAASYVINYDDTWNPATMAQREDRAHRMGQKEAVTVVNFVCADTIEERVRDVLYTKASVSARTLGDNVDEAALMRLGPEDLAKLL